MLERGLEQTAQTDVATKMHKSLDAMGDLMDTLLDVSRFDSGTITPEFSVVDVHDVLEQIVLDNVQQARDKNLTLHRTESHSLVWTDPSLLARIIENFVSNAIRYTQQGHIELSCETVNNLAWIRVSDTGIGIPKEDLSNIFEEYFQLGNPVRERRKGLGLGLSIVQHTAKLLDAQIRVTSELGLGSVFSVGVPVANASIAEVAPASVAPPVAETSQGLTILLVDDDNDIVDATNLLLTAAGHRVYSGNSGDEILAILGEQIEPDLLVTDYRLPLYNGLELISKVRARTRPDLPSILITGDTLLKDDPAARISQCELLTKPIDADSLLNQIDKLTPR